MNEAGKRKERKKLEKEGCLVKRGRTVLLACMFLCAGLSALAQSAPDPHTLRLYYNPQGGTYCHIEPNCAYVSPKYLPLQLLPEGKPEGGMPSCPDCMGSTQPLFTVTGGSVNMPNLRADVYLTTLKVPQWEEDQVYRIHLTDQDRASYPFADLLFPSMEGGEGLAPLVKMEDLNFDGYPDLKALRIQGASNEFSTFFLYEPADGQYHYEPALDDLSAYVLYPEEKLISNFIHDSAATNIRQLYRIGENGQPMLFRRASVLHDEQGSGQSIRILVAGYDPAGRETILMDELRGPFLDEADYRASEQKWLGLLYEGLPEYVAGGFPLRID